jgi:hypothetical protein
MNWKSREATVFTVSVPALQSASITGSGDIEIDRVAGDRFQGRIAGSGGLRLPRVAVKELGLSIAGSGGITAVGQAQTATYTIAGSGDMDVSSLVANNASAEISGSGDIKANVTGTAKARVAGSGDISIRGGARCESRTAGSGDIRCS